MRFRGFHFLFLSFALMAAMVPGSPARADPDVKYPLITAYIYNFTQLSTWPASAIGEAFTICVVGDDPFGSAMDAVRTREAAGKKISVRRFSSGAGGLGSCNVLFIADSEDGNVENILAAVHSKAVLTVSDISGFTGRGGMVEFKPQNGKIGISVNISAVRAANISISSKLLSLVNVKE
jgi:hypothetical protein